MSDPNPEQMRAEGWGNCVNPSCGYFFKQQQLTHCPACRSNWRLPPVYNQPAYEPPGLS